MTAGTATFPALPSATLISASPVTANAAPASPGLTSVESVLTRRATSIGELEHIDTLVRNHQGRLLRLLTYTTGDLDLAQSITQDTLLKAYNGRESFRGECSVSTWITGIALNVTRDHLRTQKYKFWKRVRASAVEIGEMASFLPASGATPETRLLATEKVEALAASVARLSKKQRTVFLLRFTEELSVEEIAQMLGMGVNTVRTHLHRALTAVRGKAGGAK